VTFNLANDAHLDCAPKVERHIVAVFGSLEDAEAHASVLLVHREDLDFRTTDLEQSCAYELLSDEILNALRVDDAQLVEHVVAFAHPSDTFRDRLHLRWLVSEWKSV